MFITLFDSAILLFLFMLIYGIYAIISNVKSCDYNSDNLLPQYQQLPRYLKLINDGTFQASLLGYISCMTDTKAYEIQCWLGVVCVALFGILAIILRYIKLRIYLKDHKTKVGV